MKTCFASPVVPDNRRRGQPTPWLALGALLLFACNIAKATILCVATVNGGLDAHDYGLVAAFNAANTGAEGGTWDIRLRSNTYQLSGNLEFKPDGSHDNKQFYLSGGWDSTCANQTGDASNTIIRGVAPTQTGYSTKFTFTGDNERFDIEKVRFENFARFSLDDHPCDVLTICPDTHEVIFQQDEFSKGGWMSIRVGDADKFLFRNNLVTKLTSVDASSQNEEPILFLVGTDGPLQEITFNTFADLSCKAGDVGAFSIFSRVARLSINHNIFQSTACPYDLQIRSGLLTFADSIFLGKALTPYYNVFGTIGGSYKGDLLDNGNQVTTNVKFVDAANGNFRLQQTSPATNTGATLTEALLDGFIFSPTDLDAKLRPIAAHFDIGAYETSYIDNTPAVITVNSSNDVDDGTCDFTHCSLREAINFANLQGASASQRIVFDMPGACPVVIALKSELPDIKVPLTIDGYTQPDASENELDYGSDANICVAFTPAATGLTYALRVPTGQSAARLVARGLAFGNGFYAFGTAAIELLAGSGHRIVGNAFGGYFPPSHNTAFIGNLPRGVVIRGTATDSYVGGPANADRNYFGTLTQNGIVLNDATSTGHTIQNNYIGVRPDGLTAQANQADGISASGGSNVTITGNTIAASDWGISLLGANTQGFTLTGNRIGLSAIGTYNNSLSNNDGIAIGLGSGGHFIGGVTATDVLKAGKASNYIANNVGDGILMSADAGQGNVIRGNAIFSNGKGGDGIGIDLNSSLTQLPNDAADADSGGNGLQNYPVISGSQSTDAAHRQVNAVLSTAANQAVRVDFYQSPTCGGVKGADATNLAGSASVNSGATGTVAFSASIAEFGTSGYLTATATTSSGQTSELAPCVLEDVIFAANGE